MRRHGGLVLLALALVALAFVRTQYFSSTGIRVAGDGADYAQLAAGLELEGRAPFLYRPAVPFLVGFLFPADVPLGFAIVSAIAMFFVFVQAGAAARDRVVGYGLATLLFLNYQVLFAAANVARLDIVVLAIQLFFVSLALRGKLLPFLLLLPLVTPVKETLLLGLGALFLVAFPRTRPTLARGGAAAAVFVAIHLLIRGLARPTSAMPPYAEGLTPAALWDMLSGNLTALLPLRFFVAFSGLCFIALHIVFRARRSADEQTPGGAGRSSAASAPLDPLLIGTGAFLLIFPMPLATDLHRAWFELLAPVVLYAILASLQASTRAARPEGAGATASPDLRDTRRALGAALVASLIPYGLRIAAPDHLFLLILQERLTAAAVVALTASLAGAALALVWWIRAARGNPTPP